MPLTAMDVTRHLDRYALEYTERPAGRFIIREGSFGLTLVADAGRWHWTTAKAQGTVADDAALEALLDRVIPD